MVMFHSFLYLYQSWWTSQRFFPWQTWKSPSAAEFPVLGVLGRNTSPPSWICLGMSWGKPQRSSFRESKMAMHNGSGVFLNEKIMGKS